MLGIILQNLYKRIQNTFKNDTLNLGLNADDRVSH